MTSQQLKEARQSLGLTQKQMATAMGMRHQQQYNMIENRRNPTLQHANTVRLLIIIKNGGLIDKVFSAP
jgi:transcriptional regulator with XRE-family HTH domain